MKEHKYRKMNFQKWIARGSLIAGFFWGIFFSYAIIEESIPDTIRIEKGEAEDFDFRVPMTAELDQEGMEVFGNHPVWIRIRSH